MPVAPFSSACSRSSGSSMLAWSSTSSPSIVRADSFEAALRLWDERTHLYQYVLKRPAALEDDPPHPHPGVDVILRRRTADRKRLGAPSFTVSLYLVVVVDTERAVTAWTASARRLARAPLATVRDALSTTSTVVDLDADVAQRAAHLRHKVDAFVQQLEDTVAPRVLAQAEAFTLFRRLLNYTPEKADGVRLRRAGMARSRGRAEMVARRSAAVKRSLMMRSVRRSRSGRGQIWPMT